MTEYIPNANDYELADVQNVRDLLDHKIEYYRNHYPTAWAEIQAMEAVKEVLWDLESDLAEL